MSRVIVAVVSGLLTIGLACATSGPGDGTETCEGFPEWTTSAYVLPYPVGKTYTVDQANCSPPGNGHRGAARYGYDFLMPIGTTVTAARGGVVVYVDESHFDGEIASTGKDNVLLIRHDDGTFALYGHFTHDGVSTALGEHVNAGDQVGLSGNTGNTANKPHLHFSVTTCNPVEMGTATCPTIPITFRNTDPNPNGLQAGTAYTAR